MTTKTLFLKTPGLSNPKNYVLTNNRLNTYLVLIYGDLNKAPIYKMPYRDSPHHEIEILMSFIYLNLFKPNEHTEDYHIRKPNDQSFLFKIEELKLIYVGEKLDAFETNDEIVNYSSDLGFNDIKYPFAYSEENIYFMLHQKCIPLQEYKTSAEKNDCHYLYRKNDELKGDNLTDENERIIEYGNDFIICKVFHDRDSTNLLVNVSENIIID